MDYLVHTNPLKMRNEIRNYISKSNIASASFIPGVNGRQDTNGSPVISRGHEQIGVKPLKLQSALTPVSSKQFTLIEINS